MYTNCFLNKDFDNAAKHLIAQYKADTLGGSHIINSEN
jgi:hypothetical protein